VTGAVRGISVRRISELPAQVVDLALAGGLTLFDAASTVPDLPDISSRGVAVVLLALQTLPLVWRRRHPEAVFLVIGAARVSYDLARLGPAPFPLSVAVAVYTVADRCPPRVRRRAGAGLAAGILASQLGSPHHQPYDLTVAVLIFVAAWMTGVAGRTRRAYVRETELRARRAESDLDREVERAAQEERTRIAREMHDVVAHHVSLIAVQAEAAGSLLPSRPAEAGRSVDVIATTAREALRELRSLLGVLRTRDETTEVAPGVSLERLDPLVRKVRDAGLTIDVSVTGTAHWLPAAVDLTAYRIIQEALTNTVRHAQASHACVTIAYEPTLVAVTIEDNGAQVGDEVEPPGDGERRGAVPTGYGLAGIAERVASCGGTLRLGPVPTGGFRVVAHLPTI
jgi:signal transduction histidine kinase